MEAVLDRTKFIGGSDAAAILGVSPYKTPYQLWMEKTGQVEDDFDVSRDKVLRRGKMLEPYVIEMTREEYGIEIVSRNQRFCDPELSFLSCEIDFEWMDVNGVQNADVKTVHPRVAYQWGEQGTDEIPLHYTVQFLFGQMIRGCERTLCSAMIGADDLRIYRTERDEEMISLIRQRCIDFWEMVDKHVAPPITSLADVNLAWPKDSGNSIEATSEIVEIIERYKLFKKGLAGDEAKCELMELDIFKFMKDHTEIVDSNGKKLATRKLQERKGYTVEPVKFRVFRAA